MIDFFFGVAVGMLINLVIAWLFPGPLPRARIAQADNHLYLHEDTHHITILRGFDRDKLRAVAIRAINGKPLTYEAMTGRYHMFTREEWGRLRNQLNDRGYLNLPRNEAPIVTERGRVMFDSLARGER